MGLSECAPVPDWHSYHIAERVFRGSIHSVGYACWCEGVKSRFNPSIGNPFAPQPKVAAAFLGLQRQGINDSEALSFKINITVRVQLIRK